MKKNVFILSLLLTVKLFAQTDPVQWNNTVKKIDGNTYEIHLTASVQGSWHLYSQHTPAGGPVPTTVAFTKNPVVITQGDVKEIGEAVTKREEVFGIDVKYFSRAVDFVQLVKTKGKIKTNMTGSVKYMVCNDKECLPPKTVSFQLELK
ncbi:MAG: protein-disulfide reductase DsbD domain-containing protein [Bacteroidota bacterium]